MDKIMEQEDVLPDVIQAEVSSSSPTSEQQKFVVNTVVEREPYSGPQHTEAELEE